MNSFENDNSNNTDNNNNNTINYNFYYNINNVVDINSRPSKSVVFEKKVAYSIFCVIHFLIYILIITRKGTVLDQAFIDRDYFYLTWTHCIFFSAIISYFLILSKSPGFVKLDNNINNHNIDNNNSNNNDNTFILDEGQSCLPGYSSKQLLPPQPQQQQQLPIQIEINNNSSNSNIRKVKKRNSNEGMVSENDEFNSLDISSNNSSVNNNYEDGLELNEINKPLLESDSSNSNNNINIKNEIISDNNEIDNLKPYYYCKKCAVNIPLRTKHCAKCDRCVLKYDHHCVFIGACVGLHNHKYFLLFLAMEATLLLLGLRIIVTAYIWQDTLKEWFWSNYYLLPPTLLMVGGFCLPFFLFLFHSFLILSNQTSWEFNKYKRITYLKQYSKYGINPFDKGVWSHFTTFLKGIEKPSDWKLLTRIEVDHIKKKRENTFNIWNNKYYSCC